MIIGKIRWKLPKKIRKKLNKKIRNKVLEVLGAHKNQYFKVKTLRDIVWEQVHMVRQQEIINYFLGNYGLKSAITSAIHYWREEGIPIISTETKGTGYVYIDPNKGDTPSYWDSKFRGREKFREKKIPQGEKKMDTELFNNCLKNCKNPKIRNKMKKVAKQHGITIK